MEGYRMLFKIGANGEVKDTLEEWGIALIEMPKIIPLKKKIFSQSWFDEDGDDDYIPSTLKYEAAECEFTFSCKNIASTLWAKFNAFVDYLNGGTFTFYNEYEKIGRDSCWLKEVKDDARYSKQKVVRNGQEVTEEILQFKMVFKINAPKDNVTLTLS